MPSEDPIADGDPSDSRRFQARDHAQDGGFAAAGRAKHSHEGVVLNGETQIFHRIEFTPALCDMFQFDFRHGFYPPIPLSRLAPVILLTSVLQTRMVMIRIRLMPLEKAYSPISSK